MKPFTQRFIESCERHPEKVAMRVVGDDAEIYTFGELLRQVRAVAYRLERENIAFGDKIALIGENHPCWEVAYLATLYRGAVCVPLDPHGEIETLTNFLENSEAKLAFLSPDGTEKFRQIEEKLGRPVPAVAWRMENATNGFQKFEDWTKTEFPAGFAEKIPSFGGDDAALLMYTSGTTGTPKGVPLTHGNIVAELDGINEVLSITEKDKILSLLPLFHVYLQIVNLWTATTYGCEVGYLKELTPAELSEAMKSFKPTILTTVPRLWYLFHKKIFDAVEAQPKPVRMIFRTMFAANGILRDTFKINAGNKFFGKVHEGFGGNLRFAITAGSRFDEAVAIDFHKLGFNILQGYGLTETSGAATATYEDDNRVGSVGKPFVNAEVKLRELNAEGIGEVLIKGGMVFKGYYKNEEATRATFTEDGWFRTGDLGKFDKDGHLYIVGRAKDVIVLPSGKNVHPEDLEVHYLKTPLVEEMAILGVKDETAKHAGAEKLAAVIVPDFAYLKANNIANSREAIRHELDNLGRELPEYQRVRDYIIRIEPLPRTATRKIRRFELQKEIESGALSTRQARDPQQWKLSPEDKNLLDSNAGRAVAAAIRKNAKDAETVHPAMNLEIDLGLDSLSRAEVFASLEQAFGIEFDGDEAAKALTVTDVVELVRKHAGEAETTSDITADLNWSKIVRETGTDLPEIRHVLKNRPVFSTFAWLAYKTFNLFFTPFTRLEVRGIENLRAMRRPFLVCPNHQSFLDPFVVCSLYPLDIFRSTFHVGASEFFQNALMRWLSRMLNVVPIDPDTQLMRAMKAGAAGLKSGKVLNIYPEGERAFDGRLHEFKKGAAILATELDLPILPVALDGLHKVWARASWRIRPAKVKIRFGEPFYARDIAGAEMSDEQKYEAVIKHLKETIAAMIAEMRAAESE
jgi:long-chain acyl-CoA synthetase